jgi:hypothetical protein
VILIDGVQDVINRLVYIYLNPVRAGLVKRIEDYPGFNTWQAFISCAPEVDATVKINAHWIPVSAMDSLPKNNKLSSSEDTNMVSAIKRSKHTIKYELEIQPFKWLEKFGITDPVKIEEIRQIVIGRVKEEEQNLQAERELRSARVIGANRLREQEYLKAHTPDKKGRKIFLICCDNDRRPTLIDQFKSIIDKCKECYKALKDGLPHEWPPGTYVPWIPPTLCRAPLSG